jgi:hypothetical protein
MATTTTEGTPSQADGHPVSGLPPAPFHLCFDGLDDGLDGDVDPAAAILDCAFADGPDDDAFFTDGVSDELSRSELIDLDAVLSTDNVRSHAEVPEPDGFGLPSHDCIVYRIRFVCSNHRSIPADIDVIVCGDTSRTLALFDATRRGVQLQELGQKDLQIVQPAARGMGWESTVRFSVVHPMVTGEWFRDLAEEALLGAERRLPSPAPVPSESRAVRVTELPVARWQRLNASSLCSSRTSPESARGAA